MVVSGASAWYQLGFGGGFKGRRERFEPQLLLLQGRQVNQTGAFTHAFVLALTYAYIMKSRIVAFVIN